MLDSHTHNSVGGPQKPKAAVSAALALRKTTNIFYLRAVIATVSTVVTLAIVFGLPRSHVDHSAALQTLSRTSAMCSLCAAVGLCVPCFVHILCDWFNSKALRHPHDARSNSTNSNTSNRGSSSSNNGTQSEQRRSFASGTGPSAGDSCINHTRLERLFVLPSQKMLAAVVQAIVLLAICVPNGYLLSEFLHSPTLDDQLIANHFNGSMIWTALFAQSIVVLNAVLFFALHSLSQQIALKHSLLLFVSVSVLYSLRYVVHSMELSKSMLLAFVVIQLVALAVALLSLTFLCLRLWKRWIRKDVPLTAEEMASLALLSVTILWLVSCAVIDALLAVSVDGEAGNALIAILVLLVALLGMSLSISAIEKTKLLEEEAEIALERKRLFVRHVSHEIRTPLNTTLLGLELLQQELAQVNTPLLGSSPSIDVCENSPNSSRETPPMMHRAYSVKPRSGGQLGGNMKSSLQELVTDIHVSSSIAIDILNDLLLYEKIDGNLLSLDLSPSPVWAFVTEVVKVFRIQARSSSIDLVYPESCLDHFVVNIDKYKLSQVLRNLISNALKFTSAFGTVTVNAHIVSESPNATFHSSKRTSMPFRRMVRISVKDTGAGISVEDQKRLFHEIVQFDADKLQQGKGSGLGLWISTKIVDLHGGRIGVHSDGVGCGSTFYIEIPLLDPVSTPASPQHANQLEPTIVSPPNDSNRYNALPTSPTSLLSEALDTIDSPMLKQKPSRKLVSQSLSASQKHARSADSNASTSVLNFIRSSFAFAADSFGSSASTRSVYVDPAYCELSLAENGEFLTPPHQLQASSSSSHMDHLMNLRSSCFSPVPENKRLEYLESGPHPETPSEDNNGSASPAEAEFEVSVAVQRTSIAVVKSPVDDEKEKRKNAFLLEFYAPAPTDVGVGSCNPLLPSSQASTCAEHPVTSVSEQKPVESNSAVAPGIGPFPVHSMPVTRENSSQHMGDSSSMVAPSRVSSRTSSSHHLNDALPSHVIHSPLRSVSRTCSDSTKFAFHEADIVTSSAMMSPLMSPASVDSEMPPSMGHVSSAPGSPSRKEAWKILREKRALIVDDSVSNRKVVNRLLRDKVRHRLEARDGKEACDLVTHSLTDPKKAIDLVILDFYMPTMDGPDTARALRAMGFTGLIIGVTGNGHDADVQLFKESGVDTVLMKPLNMESFWSFVLNWFRSRSTAISLESSLVEEVNRSVSLQ